MEFVLAKRLVIRDRVAPFKASIKKSRLRRGVRFRIRALVTMQDARRVRLTRDFRACR